MSLRGWIGSVVLLVVLTGVAGCLAAWKYTSMQGSEDASGAHTEPVEAVMVAVAAEREHRPTTTSIGTVLALRSVTLRNESAGTVRRVDLPVGEVVEAGRVLVALDVSVEEAELRAHEAQAALAQTTLERVRRAGEGHAVSALEVDRARAERDVALAQIDRLRAIIDRKTVRAPFRARVGLADVHPGQYLEEGTLITTLQGVDDGAHVDFAVAQHVAAAVRVGDVVEVLRVGGSQPLAARVVAVDARVDPATRNATVRARIEPEGDGAGPRPGASVRVRVPTGPSRSAVVVPVSALRRGPGGDHVFVITTDAAGAERAQERVVRAGAAVGDEVTILEGLSPGEVVAATGSFKLREGVRVAVAGERPVVAARGRE